MPFTEHAKHPSMPQNGALARLVTVERGDTRARLTVRVVHGVTPMSGGLKSPIQSSRAAVNAEGRRRPVRGYRSAPRAGNRPGRRT